MTIFWPGLLTILVLYVVVFGVGVWAGKQTEDSNDATELLLAGRSLPLWVGLLTMTATWVGGGYINGTAEYTYSSGVAWGAQAGIGYALSLIVGGLFFARKMRAAGFATLVDPLEARYGRGLAAVLMLPAILAEVFWSAAILLALGTTFSAVIGIDLTTSILFSSVVAVAYTAFGGLRAVAYTDVVQLLLIVVGLGLAIPPIVHAGGPNVWTGLTFNIGSVAEAVSWGDFTFLLILGGIPWNVYFQRVLSAPSPNAAMGLSIGAGLLCGAMAIPPVLIGLSAQSMDWAALSVSHGMDPATLGQAVADQPALVLPYALRYATPTWIGVLGLGAVGAAVMSSVDSSILSAASLATWNGYRTLFEPELDGSRLTFVVRVFVVLLGTVATVIALSVGSVSALWLLCGDLVYSILFPQLTLALFDKRSNRIGAIAGLGASLFLRVSGGDSILGIPAFLPWPSLGSYDFPFRTVAMLSGLLLAMLVSRATTSIDPPRDLVR